MAAFETPTDLTNNHGLVTDAAAFAREHDAASWLYLCGAEFEAMDEGLSYDDIQAAVGSAARVVSDPPVVLDMDLARRQIAALDELPRPTVVTCRTGPRSSALIYLYAGLRTHASPDDVIARATADGAPWADNDAIKAWVTQGLNELG